MESRAMEGNGKGKSSISMLEVLPYFIGAYYSSREEGSYKGAKSNLCEEGKGQEQKGKQSGKDEEDKGNDKGKGCKGAKPPPPSASSARASSQSNTIGICTTIYLFATQVSTTGHAGHWRRRHVRARMSSHEVATSSHPLPTRVPTQLSSTVLGAGQSRDGHRS